MPNRRAKPVTRNIDWPLALVENKGKILLRRRPAGGILPGLWEIPGGERKRNETLRAALRRHLNGAGKLLKPQSAVAVIRHTITNRKIRAPVYLCAGIARPHGPRWRWVRLSALGRHPLSSLSLKAARLLARP